MCVMSVEIGGMVYSVVLVMNEMIVVMVILRMNMCSFF